MNLPAPLSRLLDSILCCEYDYERARIDRLSVDEQRGAVEESAHLAGCEGVELHPLFPQLAAAFGISEDVWRANFEQGRIDAGL